MTEEEARRLLLLHSCGDDSDPEKFGNGFVGQLRPYRGTLNEANFLEVMEAIRVIAPRLAGPTVDRELMSALWAMTWLPRAWAFSPGGMLRRNGLIGGRELSQLDDWLNRISEAVHYPLEGVMDYVDDALVDYPGEPYSDYLAPDA